MESVQVQLIVENKKLGTASVVFVDAIVAELVRDALREIADVLVTYSKVS
jgi:hypothetical protein